jgi:hypothetical protein
MMVIEAHRETPLYIPPLGWGLTFDVVLTWGTDAAHSACIGRGAPPVVLAVTSGDVRGSRGACPIPDACLCCRIVSCASWSQPREFPA